MSAEIIEEKAKETVTIGDKVYSIDDVSPTTYFNYVKDMRKNIEDENLQTVADNCLELLKKTKITGQTKIAEKIFNEYSLIIRELKAASFGFDTIVYKSDIEKFITKISNHPVKLIELKNYPREVADDVLNKLMIAKDNDLFDEYYVVFTDYTGEETKKIAEIRDQKRNAQETRTLSDSTKDLLTQNDQKAEAILPKITQSMDSIKDLVESMNTMTQKVSTIAANTEEISSQTTYVQNMTEEMRDEVKEL